MSQEQASREAIQRHRECLTATVLQGYCRDLPMEMVTRILEINRRYGSWAAMQAAIAVVTLSQMSA